MLDLALRPTIINGNRYADDFAAGFINVTPVTFNDRERVYT